MMIKRRKLSGRDEDHIRVPVLVDSGEIVRTESPTVNADVDKGWTT